MLAERGFPAGTPKRNLQGIKQALPKPAFRKGLLTIGPTYKPRSVRSWLDETSKAIIGTIIHLDPASPRGSSSLPEAQEERAAPRPPKCALPLLGLAPDGGCLAADIATGAGGLLHHLFTLSSKGLRPEAVIFCGPIPGLPRPGVTRHHALQSADFPQAA